MAEKKEKAPKAPKPSKPAKGAKTSKGKGKPNPNEPVVLKEPTANDIKLVKTFPFLAKTISKGKDPVAFALAVAKASTPQKLPQVNLLPPEVTLRVTLRKTRFGLMLTTMSVLLIIVLTYLTQSITISSAQRQLDQATAHVNQSQTKVNQYIPIQKYFDTLSARIDLGKAKIGQRLDYARILLDVKTAMGGYTLSNLGTTLINQPTDPKSAPKSLAEQCGPINDPFSTDKVPLVACITFGGSVPDRNQMSSLINRLSAIPYLSNVNLTQTGQGGGATANSGILFTGSAAVSNLIVINKDAVVVKK